MDDGFIAIAAYGVGFAFGVLIAVLFGWAHWGVFAFGVLIAVLFGWAHWGVRADAPPPEAPPEPDPPPCDVCGSCRFCPRRGERP